MYNAFKTLIIMITSIWRHRRLVHTLVRRELIGRYQGSFFGLMWSFINPVFMLCVYTFVFSEVFKARWGSGSESKSEFALVLFAGLIVFNLFAECISRAPCLILSNPNYVKKVVFPLEILPFVSLLSSLYHALASLCVWLAAYIFLIGVPHITLLYIPLVLLPLCLLIMGLSWILASLGVFVRDISQLIGPLTTMLMFLSPIFYPVSALPEQYQALLYFNPLTPIIEMTRNILYWGKTPEFDLLGIYILVTLIMCWAGFAWFQKTRKGFADVL